MEPIGESSSFTRRHQLNQGLIYTHSRLNANARKVRETAAYTYALIELLHDKGLIGVEELESRRAEVDQQLLAQFKQEGNGVAFQDPEQDKYTFTESVAIDCANRVQHCKGSCCRLPFALSRQDVREGIVRWDLGRPYLIEHGVDGYCTHLEQGNCGCSIYAHRPVPCRGYDCRNDQRIWVDFDQMIPNPTLADPEWPYCLIKDETLTEDEA